MFAREKGQKDQYCKSYATLNSICMVFAKSEYDQEIPQSHTADQTIAP